MSKIIIDIEEAKNIYSLVGDIDELLKKRRVRLYLNDFLKADVTQDNIFVPYEEDSKEYVLTNIRELLDEQGIEEGRGETVNKALESFMREEENFKIFSAQAYSIRNNNLSQEQKDEFQYFSESLKTTLPNRTLYELQLLSAYHLAFSQNACNFSVPGAGKTSVVYGAYSYLKNLPVTDRKFVSKIMIVGPLSSFGPWEMEYEECFGRKADVKRLSGGVSREERMYHFYGSNPAEISLLSYNGLSAMFDELVPFLEKYPTMIVLDEAHKIKNINGGVWATAALELSRYGASRVVLTGTPAPNGYEDIFNLFKFIWPTKDVIKFYPYHLKEMSENPRDGRIKELIENLSPFFIRIRKKDLELPHPIEHKPVIVPMGEVQSNIYKYIEKNYMNFFVEQAEGSTSVKSLLTRARLIRLMQVSTNPSLLKKPLDEFYIEQGYANDLFVDDTEIFSEILNYRDLEDPPKFFAASELIKQILARKEKVIVWTIFIQNILEFQEYLLSEGILSRTLYGATPVEKEDLEEDIETRESIIREFHNPDCEYKVIIANPFAVAESISLHKACNNAIYLERSFNAGNFIQSKDRIHRYGLAKDAKVNYYYILSENNIDQTIHERLIQKEKRMMKIIENEPIPLFGVLDDNNEDNEDMRVLINNYVNSNISKN